MSAPLIVALFGLALLFAALLAPVINAIRIQLDEMYDDVRGDAAPQKEPNHE